MALSSGWRSVARERGPSPRSRGRRGRRHRFIGSSRETTFGAALAQLHQRFVHRDANQPGVKARVSLEAVEILEGFQERVLHRVFGVFAVLRDVHAEAENLSLVAVHQFFKGSGSPDLAAEPVGASSSRTMVEASGLGSVALNSLNAPMGGQFRPAGLFWQGTIVHRRHASAQTPPLPMPRRARAIQVFPVNFELGNRTAIQVRSGTAKWYNRALGGLSKQVRMRPPVLWPLAGRTRGGHK